MFCIRLPFQVSSCLQAEDAEELAARQRLGRLSTRNSAAHSSRPPASSSAASSTGGTARQTAASMSGRHIAPPKLSPDDSWAAELDNDDSWDSIDQKTAAGAFLAFSFSCNGCCLALNRLGLLPQASQQNVMACTQTCGINDQLSDSMAGFSSNSANSVPP